VQCTTSLCHPDAAYRPSLFNETASETFVPSDKRSSVAYVWTSFKGTLGNDVANLAGITVEQQEFLDATEVSAPGFIPFYRSYDGVLGLAPFSPSDESDIATYPSLFKSMVRDKLITHNTFTLELPQGKRFVEDDRTPGFLRFGQSRISPSAENVIRLPLSGRSIAEQTWYSPGTDLDWDQGRLQLQIGPNYPIQIDPGSLAIRLPKPLASRINQQISLPDSDHHIDCNERSNLPSLVLTFEGGSRLELTPINYILERRFSNGTLMGCMSLFYDTDRVPGIVVGAGVLEHFITEWDLDRKEIRSMLDLQFRLKYLKFLLTGLHYSEKAEQVVAE
jgi:saccharopepsin